MTAETVPASVVAVWGDDKVPVFPAGAPALSGAVSSRDVGHPAKRRPLVVLDPQTGLGCGPDRRSWIVNEYPRPMDLGDVLRLAERVLHSGMTEGSRLRIVLTTCPWDTVGSGFTSRAARSWVNPAELPDGWSVNPARTPYAGDDEDHGTYLTGEWQRTLHGRAVSCEVQMARVWVGRDVTDPAAYWQAWWELEGRLLAAWSPHDVRAEATTVVMATPGNTGSRLWLASIGSHQRKVDRATGELLAQAPMLWPLPSDEVRDTLKATSGQGRFYVAHPDLVPDGTPVPVLSHWDMRVAYASALWDMPCGQPARVTPRIWQDWGEQRQQHELKGGRQWLRVRATVPDRWRHVGILPARREGVERGWTWPHQPGRTFTTWASGAEINLAMRYGWRVDVLDGWSWESGRPLELWRKRLLKILSDTSDPMVERMVRSIILHTVGTFGAAVRMGHTTVSAEQLAVRDDPDDVGAPSILADGRAVVTTAGDLSGLTERVAHTPWAVMTWGRVRARVLYGEADRQRQQDGRMVGTPTGALTVAPDRLLAIRTDGLLLGCDPSWPVSGRIGELRPKGRMTEEELGMLGPIPVPRTHDEVIAMQQRADEWMERRRGQG